MYQAYKDKAAVYIVYILEAHPTDGWQVRANEQDRVLIEQHKNYEDRAKAAGSCMKDLKLSIPCLVDDMENTAQKAYAGWPDRLYVIDAEGKVVYQGGPGPRGFRPDEAERALKKLLD